MNASFRQAVLDSPSLQKAQQWGGSLLNLALRFFVGWQFFHSGWLKVTAWSNTLALFQTEYHVPLLPPHVAAVMGASGELGFSTLLFLGLFSRLGAVGLLFVNAMAVISYPKLFTFDCPAAINDHFYWAVLLLVLLVWGPGKIAADTLIWRR